MATTTPNFGWPVPTSTDLVKDGATAIEALGDGIDTSLVDLKGGTTGQILAKATSADMDFTWITNDVGDITAVTAGTGISGGGTSGAVTITNSMATEIAAKGDLIVGTGSQTFDNLTAGSNYGFLQADSAQATGLLWNNAAWTSFTPVVTSGTGSITTYTASAAYTRIGKLCVMRFTVTVTTPGTAAGSMYLTIPFNAVAANSSMGAARETAVVGFMSSVTATTTRLEVNKYDNTTPFGAGFVTVGTISYEVE